MSGGAAQNLVRVVLPAHLQILAGVRDEISVPVTGPPTQRSVIDALESAYPALAGTLRDPATGRRRPLVRFYACRRDLSHAAPDDALPAPVADGSEPYLIVGAIAGG